jgi:hypothetical protein
LKQRKNRQKQMAAAKVKLSLLGGEDDRLRLLALLSSRGKLVNTSNYDTFIFDGDSQELYVWGSSWASPVPMAVRLLWHLSNLSCRTFLAYERPPLLPALTVSLMGPCFYPERVPPTCFSVFDKWLRTMAC